MLATSVRTFATSVICLLLAPAAAGASVSRLCDVSYLTPQGWSTPMRREVVFQSGRELNKTSTNYFSYASLGKYAVIAHSPGEIAILEISAALVPDTDGFSNDNFKRLFSVSSEIEAAQVNASGAGRKWKISAKEGLQARFIDPRVEGDAKKLNRAGWPVTPPSAGTPRAVRSSVRRLPSSRF